MASPTISLRWDKAKFSGIETKAVKGLLRMGYDIANQARRNAPYLTGALSNSIRVEENAGEVEVIAGGKAGGKDIRYAAIQEFGGRAGRKGSVKITGKHYMERARDAIMSGNYLEKYFGDLL